MDEQQTLDTADADVPAVDEPADAMEVRAPAAVALSEPLDMNRLMAIALEKGKEGADALTTLAELSRSLAADQAKREFSTAMANFQLACPTIARNKTTEIKHRGGGSHDIKFTELDYMVITMAPHLQANGLSYTFSNAPDCPTDHVQKVVRIYHSGGHSEDFMGPAFPVEKSQLVSPAQCVGIADSYSKRYTLSAAFGVVTGGDSDGALPKKHIDENQTANILALMEEVGADNKRLLQLIGVDQIAHITCCKGDVGADDKRIHERGCGYRKAVNALYAMRSES